MSLLVTWPVSAALHPSSSLNREILVKFKPLPSSRLTSQTEPLPPGSRIKRTLPKLGWHLLELPPDTEIAKALDEYRKRSDVLYAEANYAIRLYATSNDPRRVEAWGLEKIGAPQAWDYTTGSTNIVVAVLDSGLDYDHPDLAGNVWTNPGEIPGNNADDDSNGYVDDVHGINLLNHSGDVRDDDGHGTHVAGIIGAVGDNGLGVAGINWNVRLLPLKIFSADDAAGTAGAVEAYDYVLALKQSGVNIRVINNSWGGPVPSRALYEAVCAAEAAGILTVCAAGNENHNNDHRPSYPANLGCDSLISVAASTPDDELATFSNFGMTVSLAAPGQSVLSTYRGARHYMRESGTSMASPYVAGAAALLLARDSSLAPSVLKALLLGTVDRPFPLQGRSRSSGRLNLATAMSRLVSGNLPALGNSIVPWTPGPYLHGMSRSREGAWGNADSFEPAISADGRFVAFLSNATNLLAGVSGSNTLVYLYDRGSVPFPTIVLACRASNGALPNSDCEQVRISGDGRFVAFTSGANNLVPGDNDYAKDVFLYDRNSAQLELISQDRFPVANADSEFPALSADGRFVVFASDVDVVAADSNGYRDIFLRDRQSGTTTRVSVSSAGVGGNFISDIPNISADGRYITFISGADNLVREPYYPAFQLYLRDRVAATTQRISKNAAGQPGNDHSLYSSLSANGRYVAFESRARNLVTGDNNKVKDIFVWDRVTHVTKRISLSNTRVQADQDCWLGNISANGRHVFFFSDASTLLPRDDVFGYNIFGYDRLTAKLTRLPYSEAGDAAVAGGVTPAASSDGRFVAFYSDAWNLMPGDGNGSSDVFLLDRGGAIPDLMIYASGDALRQGMGLHGVNIVQRRELPLTNGLAAFLIRLDNDGPSNSVFHVEANHAPPGWNARFFRGATDITYDIADSGLYWSISLPPGSNVVLRLEVSSIDSAIGESWAEWVITATGGQPPDETADAVRAVVTRPPSPPSLQVVSRASDGRIGNDGTEFAELSADGRFAVFTSTASDLVNRDYNLQEDVFLLDRQTRLLECLSRPDGTNANGRSYNPAISRDGRYVVYQSSATNLVAGDINDREDVFLFDRQTHSTTLVSSGPGGIRSLRDSGSPAISSDGRYIVFESLAGNFVAGDTNGTWDIFLLDTVIGTVECLSATGNRTGNDESRGPVISSDGSLVVFTSLASDLTATDTNDTVDVFLWQRGIPGLKLLSRTANGSSARDISRGPTISDDNRYVLFASLATNLAVTSFDTNSTTFLYDRQTDQLSQINAPQIPGRQRGKFFGARLAPNGRLVTWLAEVADSPGGSNYVEGLFLYDRITGSLTEVTAKRDGTPATGHSAGATVSADGRYIALASRAANLIGETSRGFDQLLIYDRANFQPDEWVRRATNTPYRGSQLFGDIGQLIEQTLKPGFTNIFYVAINNRGNFADRFIFKAPGKIAGLRYFIEPGGTDITAAATNKGWTSGWVAAGDSLEIRIRVTSSNAGVFSQDLLFTSRSVTDPAKVDNVGVRLLRDNDNDGLPNVWEQQYFGNSTNAVASLDSDGDGLSNLAEYISGTNPSNPASNLSITGITADSAPGITVSWLGISNRFYTLERATDSLQFTPLATLPGNNRVASYRDVWPTNPPPLFYRIRAELP